MVIEKLLLGGTFVTSLWWSGCFQGVFCYLPVPWFSKFYQVTRWAFETLDQLINHVLIKTMFTCLLKVRFASKTSYLPA